MRVEIDLDETEREAVASYADKEGYNMSAAYAQLIRDALYAQVKVDFNWGDDGEFVVRALYDGQGVTVPFWSDTEKDRAYTVSAEKLEHIPSELLEERERKLMPIPVSEPVDD